MDLVQEFERLSGPQKRGPGRRYGERARQVAVAFCRDRRRAGRSFAEIAGELGVHVATLGRWLEADEESKPKPRFHPVALADSAEPEHRSALTVTLPSGLRIEGLDFTQAVELAKVWT